MAILWKFGSDVDTDQIVPGRYAPYMRPNEDVGNAAFIEARLDFNRSAQPGDIIVAMDNFGCGSSREYAPLALKRRQVGAIIAISFARIFYRNALNLGVPLIVSPDIPLAVNDGQCAMLDLAGSRLVVEGRTFQLPDFPDFAQQILAEGGLVPFIRRYGRFPGELGGDTGDD